jgi:hypothetical protein
MSIPKYIVIPEESVDERSKFMPLTPHSKLWHKDDDYPPKCELCNKEFVLFNLKHHCRNCGKIICEDCSQYYTSTRVRGPDRVCKLCYNCVLNPDGDGKESKDCKRYMEDANLVHSKQFISRDFYIDGKQIQVGDTLTITNVTRSKNYASHVFYKARVESFESFESVGGDSFESVGNNMINLTLTETNDTNHGYNKVGEKVYLQNDNYADAYHERNDKIPSRIIIYHQKNKEFVDPGNGIVSQPIPSGYVLVTDVTPLVQGGGYKHRKNKSKRKNKRSLRRRRTSKRSNTRRKNKKVTKRLRKSRRRRARL